MRNYVIAQCVASTSGGTASWRQIGKKWYGARWARTAAGRENRALASTRIAHRSPGRTVAL